MATKKKTCEYSNGMSTVNKITVENPDNRKILDSVKDVEGGYSQVQILSPDPNGIQKEAGYSMEPPFGATQRLVIPEFHTAVNEIDESNRYCGSCCDPQKRRKNQWRNIRNTGLVHLSQKTTSIQWAPKRYGEEPSETHPKIESRCNSCSGSNFGIINTHETIVLHHQMPQIPHDEQQNHSVQVVDGEVVECQESADGTKNESQAVLSEKIVVTVCTHESR